MSDPVSTDVPNNIVKLLTALITPGQSIEDTLQQLLTERSVDLAIGAQLDLVGKLVGESRGGLDDDTYRLYIRARIATNRSNGTIADLIKVAALIINNVAATITVTPQYPAAVDVTIGAIATTDQVANVLVDLLNQAVSAGVRMALDTQYVDDLHTFSFGLGTTSIAGASPGSTSMLLNDVTVFPTLTGSAVVDAGTSVAEVITYSIVGVLFDCSALAHSHGLGAAVQVTDPGDTGFARAAVVTSALSIGATTIAVDSTADFPSSGTLYLDYETAGSQETLSYTGKTSTTFTGVSAAAHAHAAKSLIRPTTGLLGGRFGYDRVADHTTTEIDFP